MKNPVIFIYFIAILCMASCSTPGQTTSMAYDYDASVNKDAKLFLVDDIQGILTEFCVTHYDRCFDGRKFVSNSIALNPKFRQVGKNEYEVSGVHNYKGSFGKLYEKIPFSAVITKIEGDRYQVLFNKTDMPDLTHSDERIEQCAKMVYYKK